jgi:hypothetical protein
MVVYFLLNIQSGTASIFRSEAFWHRNSPMTALAALTLTPPTTLPAAVRYYRNAVETG